MPTREEVWSLVASFYKDQLERHWTSILIDGIPVEQKYGINMATCLRNHIGYAPADVSIANLIKDQFKISEQEIRDNNAWGLAHYQKDPPHKAFNAFCGRLMVCYMKPDGKTCQYFSGRKTNATPDRDNRKFAHMKLETADLSEIPLFLLPHTRNPTIIVEGPIHAISIIEHGFAAVACSGGVPNENQKKLLKNHDNLFWLPDVDVTLPSDDIMKDTDDGLVFQPGESRAQKLQRLLPHLRELPKCRLMSYPDEFCKLPHLKGKGDANDYWIWANASVTDFMEMMKQAKSLDEIEIEAIPYDAPAHEITRLQTELMQAHKYRAPAELNQLVTGLKNKFRFNADHGKWLLAIAKNARKVGNPQSNGTAPVSNFVGAKYWPFQTGQCLDERKGILYFTEFLHERVEVDTKAGPDMQLQLNPYVVSSKFELFPLQAEALEEHDLELNRASKPVAILDYRWSEDPETAYSIPSLIKDPLSNKPDAARLFNDVKKFLSTYLYVENDFFIDFLALWIFGTYVIQIFDSLAIIALQGEPQSGKSRVLELFEALCRNPLKGSSQTEAYIYRAGDAACATLLLDEQENLARKSGGNNQSNAANIDLILNDAGRKGASVGRCIGESNETYRFKTYVPICFANTGGVNSTTMSRCVVFYMKKRPTDVERTPFNRRRTRGITEHLRNQLNCWALHNAETLLKNHDRFDEGDFNGVLEKLGLQDRERDVWSSLYTIAYTIDETAGRPLKWSEKENHLSIKDEMIVTQLHYSFIALTKIKRDLISSSDKYKLFLAAIRQIWDEELVCHFMPGAIPKDMEPDELDENNVRFYATDELRVCINSMEGMEWYPKKTGIRSLRHILIHSSNICSEDDEFRWVRPGEQEKLKFLRIYRNKLDKEIKLREVPENMRLDFDRDSKHYPAYEKLNKRTSRDESLDL